jgi:hypothetical protein
MYVEKATMKKSFLYVCGAIVLGVGLMLFPSWAYFSSRNEPGPIVFSLSAVPYIKTVPSETERGQTSYDPNAQTQPADASLQILLVGFIVAMVVYFIVRRRVHRPEHLEMYRFPHV